MLDHQIQWSTPWTTGLRHLQIIEGSDVFNSGWRQWPFASVALDLGSDGVSAMSAAEYKLSLNLAKRPDPSHGGTCDFDAALKCAQMKGFWVCMVISWNLPFGVDGEETRAAMLRDSMKDCFEKHSAHNMPLFMSMCSKLAEMFRSEGHVFEDDEPIEVQVWELMRRRGFYKAMGRKCNLARFHGGLSAAMRNVNCWWADAFERVFTALEMDFLCGRAFLEKIKAQVGPTEATTEGGQSTSSKRITMDDRSILGSCKNAVAVSVWLLSNPNNERLIRMITTVAAPLKTWHEHQNKAIR